MIDTRERLVSNICGVCRGTAEVVQCGWFGRERVEVQTGPLDGTIWQYGDLMVIVCSHWKTLEGEAHLNEGAS